MVFYRLRRKATMRLNALTLHVGPAVLIWIAGLGASTSSSSGGFIQLYTNGQA